jgi:hypothetical protein
MNGVEEMCPFIMRGGADTRCKADASNSLSGRIQYCGCSTHRSTATDRVVAHHGDCEESE